MELKEQIRLVFKNALKENDIKDFFPTDIPPPQDDKYLLTDQGYLLFSTGCKNILRELEELTERKEFLSAFNAYKTIVRECAKLYKKSFEGFLMVEHELVDLVLTTSNEARLGIIQLVIAASDERINQKVFDWIASEIIRAEYAYRSHFVYLSDLFFELYSKQEGFKSLSNTRIQFFNESKAYPYKFFLAAKYYADNDYKAIETLVSNYPLVFRLMQYVVELHFIDENHKPALKYGLQYLEEYGKERRYLYSMEDKERIKKFPEYPGIDLYSIDIRWIVDFVLSTLNQYKLYDDAIEFIVDSENKYKIGSTDSYIKLYEKLPLNKRTLFFDKLYIKAANSSVFRSRNICQYTENWQPLVESMKKNSRLADTFKVYQEYKEDLKPYTKEIIKIIANQLIEYIGKDSGSSRMKFILYVLDELLFVDKNTLLEVLQKIQLNYPRRKLLMRYLDEFVAEKGIKNILT